MIDVRPIAVLLAAALLFGAAPVSAPEVAAVDDYARREADAPGLAEFEGGFHGVVFAVVVIAAVVCVITLSVDCAFCAHGHYHRLPHAEGRRGHPRP